MDVLLLEKVNKLGAMGEIVSVRSGYARNYLLPQKKALRATDDNKAYFEKQRATLEKMNAEKSSAAEKDAAKLKGLTVTMIRQASESGQLYGSVASRDIAEAITEETGVKIQRNMVEMNQNFKTLGLFTIEMYLHAEVKVEITLNIARTQEEADIQKKTGKAVTNQNDTRDEEKKPESQVKAENAADEAAESAEASVEAQDKNSTDEAAA